MVFPLSQGSQKLYEFTVPVMTGRWSRFAISVREDITNLFVYCHNYTADSVIREKSPLRFLDESYLVIGHAGAAIQQPFQVL